MRVKIYKSLFKVFNTCCRDPGPGIFQCQGSIARVTRTVPRTYHLRKRKINKCGQVGEYIKRKPAVICSEQQLLSNCSIAQQCSSNCSQQVWSSDPIGQLLIIISTLIGSRKSAPHIRDESIHGSNKSTKYFQLLLGRFPLSLALQPYLKVYDRKIKRVLCRNGVPILSYNFECMQCLYKVCQCQLPKIWATHPYRVILMLIL